MSKAKKQKFNEKSITVAFDSALDNWQEVDDVDALLAETGKTRQQLLDAVMADDEVISCREDIEGAIKKAVWRIWGDDVDEDMINRLYRNIRSLYSDFASLAILAKFGGFAVAEYIFMREPDGFLKLHQLASKDGELDNYTPKRDGSVHLTLEDESVEIDQVIKYLVLTSKAVPARPAGELLVIRAYPAVALRKRGWAYAGQFIARYAQPYVVGKQSESNFGGPVKDFTSKIFAFISGGAIGIGQHDSIDLHQLSGNGDAFELFERLGNRRIQKLLLGRVKTSELTTGSRSAQEVDDEARVGRISAYLDLMTQGVQKAIEAIIEVNRLWGMPVNAPKGIWFEYPDIKKFNKAEAEFDAVYVGTGQVRLTKQRLLNVGYEESEFEMIEPPASLSALPTNASATQLAQWRLSQNLPTILTAPDIDELSQKERQLMQPKIEALQLLCDECDSYEEFNKRVEALGIPDGGLVADLATELAASFVDGLTADKSENLPNPSLKKGG